MASGFRAAIDQNFPPQATWSTDDIPDLSGQIFLVTGGNTGIGYETVLALLAKDAKVYIAARDEEKATRAIAALKRETAREARFLHLDLADLRSIKKAAAEFSRMETKLDVLINNAGVFLPPPAAMTADGYDLQFGTNALGHLYFTTLLAPLLEAAAKSTPSRSARVVTVTSAGYTMFPKIVYESLRAGPERNKLGNFDLYNQSKFANCVFAVELGRRLGEKGIVSTACHPGLITSELGRHTNFLHRTVYGWVASPPAKGALTQLYAATSPEAATGNGKYFIPWARTGEFMGEVVDEETGSKLWAWFEAQVKNF